MSQVEAVSFRSVLFSKVNTAKFVKLETNAKFMGFSLFSHISNCQETLEVYLELWAYDLKFLQEANIIAFMRKQGDIIRIPRAKNILSALPYPQKQNEIFTKPDHNSY